MHHRATVAFWTADHEFPLAVRVRAERQFELLKTNPKHPPLRFKKLGDRNGQRVRSARVTLNNRALAINRDDGFPWFWIGDHNSYDSLLR